MRKLLKTVTVIMLAFAFVFCMSACGMFDSNTADTKKAESSAKDLTLEIADGVEPLVIPADQAATLEKIDLPAELTKEAGLTVYYSDSAKVKDYGTGKIENPDGLTLDEELAKIGEDLKGCIEKMTWTDGNKYGVVSYFEDDKIPEVNGSKTPFIATIHVFEDGDNFAYFTVWHHTSETALGESGYSFWMPNSYSEAKVGEDYAKTGIAAYKSSDESLPAITVEEWTPENPNASLADLTDTYKASSSMKFIEDADMKLSDGNVVNCCQLEYEKDGVKMANIMITFKAGEEYVRINFDIAVEKWAGYGKAFSYSIHPTK